MNRTIKILIGIAVFVLILLIILALVYRPKPIKNTETGQTITIKNIEGDSVVVPNLDDLAIVNYQDVPVIEDTDKFTIQYDKKNNVFQIYLKLLDVNDLNTYRYEAEESLAAKLMITIDELCKLSVVETVPDNGIVTLPVYNFIPKNCEEN